MENVNTIDYKGYKINVYQDLDPIDPRNDDNLGVMVCSHGRYNLGDEQFDNNRIDLYSSFDEAFADYINKKYNIINTDYYDSLNDKQIEIVWVWIEQNLVYAPLYMYEHSIIRIKIGSFYGVGLPQGHARFDSGQIGFIYVDREAIKKEYRVKKITKKVKEKVRQILEGEVKTYDNYISGQVYGYMIEDKDGNEFGGVWGFYGDESNNGLIESAKEEINMHIKNTIDKHIKVRKAQIKNKMDINKREALKV